MVNTEVILIRLFLALTGNGLHCRAETQLYSTEITNTIFLIENPGIICFLYCLLGALLPLSLPRCLLNYYRANKPISAHEVSWLRFESDFHFFWSSHLVFLDISVGKARKISSQDFWEGLKEIMYMNSSMSTQYRENTQQILTELWAYTVRDPSKHLTCI